VTDSTARIRIGVVGLGAVAQSVHLPLIQRRWDLFELVALADLSPSNRAAVGAQFGVATEHLYGSLDEMLEGESLDGVVVLTSGSHGAPALTAIEAGVAVFCEKPLAFSLAEIDALATAERSAGRPMLLLAYMKEYDPAVDALRALLPELDSIRSVDVEVLHPSPGSQLAFANLHPAARDVDPAVLTALRARDSAAVDAALGTDAPPALRALYTDQVAGSLIHDISLLRSLLGSVTTIDSATQWAADGHPGSLDFTGTIGGAARVHFGWHYLPDYPSYHETVRIHHATGSLELEFTVPYLLNAPTELRIVSRSEGGESRSTVRDVTEAFEVELARFHGLVTAQTAPLSGIAEGREDLITALRMTDALAAAQGITLGGEAATIARYEST